MKKALISAGTFALTVADIIGFYLAFKNIKTAILCSLPVFICCIIIIIISLILQLKQAKIEIESKERTINSSAKHIEELENELSNYKGKVDKLVIQNKNQRKKIQRIYQEWNGLNTVFSNAIQSSKKERFEEAYKLYLIQTTYLFNDNKENIL